MNNIQKFELLNESIQMEGSFSPTRFSSAENNAKSHLYKLLTKYKTLQRTKSKAGLRLTPEELAAKKSIIKQMNKLHHPAKNEAPMFHQYDI